MLRLSMRVRPLSSRRNTRRNLPSFPDSAAVRRTHRALPRHLFTIMFDKTKAMRSAERFLSQGKLRDAINAYREVVENDPRDVVTLNMLGDLYAKGADNLAAVNCYRSVAEHYNKQGFAQKAIAIYNKMSRIQPNSPEITQKLAELYKQKGSLKEAKSHYSTLAEHYSQQGRRVEALEIWTEIAVLDPNNTEVYMTIADAYLLEGRLEEAAEAFANAGKRCSNFSLHDQAMEAFSKAFAIDPNHPLAMRGFVDASLALGRSKELIDHLEGLIAEQPANRDLLGFLVDAHVRLGDTESAEASLVKLLEVDPTNYLKCLDVSELHLSKGDVDSAVRNLSFASEHMLVGGQPFELQTRLEKIDAAQPDRLDVVRLLARFCAWQKDDKHLRATLVRLSEIAAHEGSLEDERFALSQLAISMPQETAYAKRLKEINLELGVPDDFETESIFDKRYVRGEHALENSAGEPAVMIESDDFAIVGIGSENGNGSAGPAVTIEAIAAEDGPAEKAAADPLVSEIESIRFYIENGYTDLASKAVDELRPKYGERAEFQELELLVNGAASDFEDVSEAEPGVVSAFDMDDLRSELGLIDGEQADDSDYETTFQTAVAYKEMGLMEQAIKEFQDAADLVTPNDGTRRFFVCANLLGHCFMEMGKPNLAVKWHLRSLEAFDINDDERRGVWYELGLAYEADGDRENAAKYFEQVYSENIDFRDIGERMRNLAVAV
jgi:tetratricopeptide (TPR) repeat protein